MHEEIGIHFLNIRTNFLSPNSGFRCKMRYCKIELWLSQLMKIHLHWKIFLFVLIIFFQMINTAFASNEHTCCDDQAPCCVVMVSAKNCSSCISLGITSIQSLFSHALSNDSYQSLDAFFYSLNIHVIWRPPIH